VIQTGQLRNMRGRPVFRRASMLHSGVNCEREPAALLRQHHAPRVALNPART
jgi:hypothetical protein